MDIDRDQLLRVFAEEAEDHLSLMETGLVALETNPAERTELDAIFRSAHTVKGNGSVVGFQAIVDVAHALEGLLERWQKGSLAVHARDVSLALRAVDVLRAMCTAAVAGDEAMPPAGTDLIAALEAAREDGAFAPEPEPPPAAPPAQRHVARTLRVDVDRLDRMMNLTGEITIARNRVTQLLTSQQDSRRVLEAHREAEMLQLELQELIMKARLVSIGPTFRQYIRTVRDLAQGHGKLARLVLDGEWVEVDNTVLEHVRDPLAHLVRNAIDHGIEPPEVRKRNHKDPVGTVSLSASHESRSVVLRVSDDGAGLDRARILESAAARGREGLADLTASEVYKLIFEPGLTTAAEVTELSGRGVGLDVVRRSIESLRGSVAVESRPGRGTTFTLRVPLTMALIEGFSVGAGDETYMLPLDAVVECFDFDAEAAVRDGDRGVVNLRGEALPYVRLRGLFNLAGSPPPRENVVVVQHDGKRAGIAVDTLLGESQTVIKPLGPLFQAVAGVSGSAILGNGRVALILDVAGVLQEAHRPSCAGVSGPEP